MKKIIYLVIISSLPILSFAQTDKDVEGALKQGHQEIKPALYSSDGKSKVFNPVSNFSISSQFEKGTSGKVDLKIPLDKSEWTQFNVSAEQKISKGTSEASPFNLQGISPNSTLSFGFQSMFWRPKITSNPFKKYYKNIGEDYLKRAKRPASDISILMHDELDSEALAQLGRHSIRQPLFFNIKFSIAKDNFKYAIDSVSLKNIEENKLNTSLSASLMKVISTTTLQQILSINFEYTAYYKGGNAKDFLIRFGTTTNYISNNLVFGSPKHKHDKQVSIEYKIGKINESNIFLFGVAPSATYSIEEKMIAFQVPFYFIPSKDDKGNPKGINGGINLGYLTSTESGKWSSIKDGFKVELFIGLPFKVFE